MQTYQTRHDLGRLFAAQMIYPQPTRPLMPRFESANRPAEHDFLVLNPGFEFIGKPADPALTTVAAPPRS